ncbi:hypothetical protein HRG_013472 [Hirsutella rhossiliensis]
MATSTVRFEFMCQIGAKQFIRSHGIARSLITGANRAGEDAEYKEQFAQAMMPLMKEHESRCRSASGAFCECCGRDAAKSRIKASATFSGKKDEFHSFILSIKNKFDEDVRTFRTENSRMVCLYNLLEEKPAEHLKPASPLTLDPSLEWQR